VNRSQLIEQIKTKRSFLCVGLDIDLKKLPNHLQNTPDGAWQFIKEIIDATLPYSVAYKPNTAFYESMGIAGWELFEKVIHYLQDKQVFIIADAKRGDIGNTSTQYAETFFHTYPCHAVTVAPYMGQDSIAPFLAFPDKWAIVLGLTSNKGAEDFQQQTLSNGEALYTKVLTQTSIWGTPENLMFVIGATKAESFQEVRKIIPNHFLLVPGVGAQGGDLATVCKYGLNQDCGLLINASRSILYASPNQDFAHSAAHEAQELQVEMEEILKSNGIV